MNNKINFTIRNYLDEGTTSPFIARLMLQMFNLRDSLLLLESERNDFNEMYHPLIENFNELKHIVRKLIELKNNHLKEIQQGIAIKMNPNNRQLTILKPIDTEYRMLIKDYFIKGEIIISSIPRIAKVFDLNVTYFFKETKKFEKGIELLKKECFNADFVISHLKLARDGWYQTFNKIRNDIEHRSVKIPNIEYRLDSRLNIIPQFPTDNDGTDLVQMLENITERILELVECCVIFFFSNILRPGQFIKDIPENERNPNKVIRYRLYMRLGDQDVPGGNF